MLLPPNRSERVAGSPNESILRAAVLAVLSGTAVAQSPAPELQFDELPTPGWPAGTSVRSVALGDLDGDGDLDAILGAIGGTGGRVLVNRGRGQFDDSSSRGLFESANWADAMELADLDGDGDLARSGAIFSEFALECRAQLEE